MKKIVLTFVLILSINLSFSQERFTISQLEELGKKHNELILNSVNNLLEKDKIVNRENIIEEFKKIDYDLSEIKNTVENIVDLSIKNSNITLTSIKLDDRFSNLSKTYLIEIDNAIVEDYNSTKKNLENLKQKIVNNIKLNSNDFNLLVGTIEVAKNSADLWMNNNTNNMFSKKKNVKSIVKADAAASSAYFTGIGIAAFFPAIGTPVTAAAFLGGWAITAGVGSAYHYFGIE